MSLSRNKSIINVYTAMNRQEVGLVKNNSRGSSEIYLVGSSEKHFVCAEIIIIKKKGLTSWLAERIRE